jgi:hypothetical protein
MEKRFRLRIDQRVVGYKRETSPRMVFYSKNEFWWNGQEIHYKQIDECTGLFDKNRKLIYEWDFVRFSLDGETRSEKGVVLWHAKDKCFGIMRISDADFIPFEIEGLQLFQPSDLEVFSYLFINRDIMENLGLEDV